MTPRRHGTSSRAACRTPNAACCGIRCANFSSKRWPPDQAVERSGNAEAIAALWRDLAGQGLDLARRRIPARRACAKSCWFSRNWDAPRARRRCSAPWPPTSRLPAQQSNAARALLEDLHQGKAMIALALGRLRWRCGRGPGRDARRHAVGEKSSFVEGAQTATHFLVVHRHTAGVAVVASGAPGLKMQVTPGLAVPPFSRAHASTNTPAVRLDIPAETLADIALVARLGCAGRALGAARARVRAGRGSRQGPKAIRPAHRPIPGGPAQARQLPDQPGRRAAHARSRGRGARQRQPGLARVRGIGAGLRRSGAARRCRSRRTGRWAPSAMPRSTRRRGISGACMPISPASAACRAPAPRLPISCSVRHA